MNSTVMKKITIRQDLQARFNSTIDQKVERYLEIVHQEIIGAHHFAAASSECIRVYVDGHFISAVMVSQAVNEGIVRFIAERNNIPLHLDNDKSKTKGIPEIIDTLEQKNIITRACAEASREICRSFRNDVHHMNPKVAEIETHFKDLAKHNLQNLAKVEREIFGSDTAPNGALILRQPKYWDFDKNGKTGAYLRFGP